MERRNPRSLYPLGFGKLFASKGKTIIAFAVSLALLLYSITAPQQKPSSLASSSSASSEGDPNGTSSRTLGNLHLLIPASRPDVNLCKTLLSASVLGYPSPVIINWKQTFDDPGLVEGGSHLAKITGIHDYLKSLDSTHDDDLVLMIDGYDIWLQLRPQTLVDRYINVNRRANEKLEQRLGAGTTQEHEIRQDIVFGCQKRCWPWSPEDPPCYAVPNSTLPEDVYGPSTDRPGSDESPFVNYRPRFLVSGTAVGTIRAFRRLFAQALVLLELETNFGSDQYILSHIFGDQEIWREHLRRDSLSRGSSSAGTGNDDLAGSHFNETHIEEVRAKAAARADGTFEFGIGIDYRSEIVLNTVFAEDDTEWLTVGDKTQVDAAHERHNVPPKHRTTDLQADIADTLPPFWTFSHEQSLPRWTGWQEVTLFTNVFTGIQPAVIHHNAHKQTPHHPNGLKELRESWWTSVWFQPQARALLDAYIYAPVTPVAISRSRIDNYITEWWPYEIWKGGARNGNSSLGSVGDGWIRFDEICQEHHAELFRDDKGPWRLPANH